MDRGRKAPLHPFSVRAAGRGYFVIAYILICIYYFPFYRHLKHFLRVFGSIFVILFHVLLYLPSGFGIYWKRTQRIPFHSSKGSTMNASLSRKTAWTALAGASLLLGACINSNENAPAVDPAFADARIDAAVAGRSLAGGFSQTKDWNALPAMDVGVEALAGVSAQVAPLRKGTALAKRSDLDLGGALHADLSDTAKGYATIYAEYELLLVNVKDTAIVKWDANAKDLIQDNENILSFKRVQTHPGGRVETAVFTDGDGDGLVTAVGGNSRARLVITVAQNGTEEKTTLLVGAGADADFDLEDDNTVLEAAWVKTEGGAVVAGSTFLDGDKDGVILDNSKDCLVTLKHYALEPADRPLVAKVEFEARVRVLARKAGDEPVGFFYKETLKSGRVNQVSIKNADGGSDIVKGGKMTVRLEATSAAAGDTLRHAAVDFVMNPGQDLKSDSDDVCYEIHIVTQKRLGLERNAEFHFISAEPIPHGESRGRRLQRQGRLCQRQERQPGRRILAHRIHRGIHRTGRGNRLRILYAEGRSRGRALKRRENHRPVGQFVQVGAARGGNGLEHAAHRLDACEDAGFEVPSRKSASISWQISSQPSAPTLAWMPRSRDDFHVLVRQQQVDEHAVVGFGIPDAQGRRRLRRRGRGREALEKGPRSREASTAKRISP